MNQERNKFLKSLGILVIPILFQNLVSAAVSSADVIMLGYVGQDTLSSASLASQIQFILNLFFAGLTSGITILASQYWGKKDINSIETLFSMGLKVSVFVSGIFAIGACFFPKALMYIFTKDTIMITIGASYLQVVGISYFLMGISQAYLATIRSMERVKTSTIICSIALGLNIFLNAVFIFGLFGFSKLGAPGAALATVIARAVELLLCIFDTKKHKELSFHPSILRKYNPVLFRDFIRFSMPALGNEVVWGVAFSMYSVIMGHLGRDIVAANSVISVARNFGTILCFGVAGGGAILLGKELGSNQLERAKRDASRLCKVTFLTGVLGGLLLLIAKPVIMNLTELTPAASNYLSTMIYINSIYIIGQAMNTCVICGVFRSGGDSRFGFVCDFIDMWLFSVPLGFLCAFVFKLPVMTVYIILCLDEFVKMPFVYKHYIKYKWLRNITKDFERR